MSSMKTCTFWDDKERGEGGEGEGKEIMREYVFAFKYAEAMMKIKENSVNSEPEKVPEGNIPLWEYNVEREFRRQGIHKYVPDFMTNSCGNLMGLFFSQKGVLC